MPLPSNNVGAKDFFALRIKRAKLRRGTACRAPTRYIAIPFPYLIIFPTIIAIKNKNAWNRTIVEPTGMLKRTAMTTPVKALNIPNRAEIMVICENVFETTFAVAEGSTIKETTSRIPTNFTEINITSAINTERM